MTLEMFRGMYYIHQLYQQMRIFLIEWDFLWKFKREWKALGSIGLYHHHYNGRKYLQLKDYLSFNRVDFPDRLYKAKVNGMKQK